MSETVCVFCRIVAGSIPAVKIYETDEVLVFLDIAPINKGHALVIPKEHHFSITTVPEAVAGAMMAVGARVGTALMRAVEADGFNLLLSNGTVAGQVVRHAHLHVIPRFADDGVVLPARNVGYADDAEKLDIAAKMRARLESA